MSQTIDVTGLPEKVVEDLKELVTTLRKHDSTISSTSKAKMTPEQWVKEFKEWISRQPHVGTHVDCSRESIYEGRGE